MTKTWHAFLTVGMSLAFASCSAAEPVPVERDISQCGAMQGYDFAACLLEAGHELEGLMIIKYLAAQGDEKAIKLLESSGIVNEVVSKESTDVTTPSNR